MHEVQKEKKLVSRDEFGDDAPEITLPLSYA
jgi:hypothetical protein